MTKIKNKKLIHAYKTISCSIKISTTLSTQPNLPHVSIKKKKSKKKSLITRTKFLLKKIKFKIKKKKKPLPQVPIKKKLSKKKFHYTHKARVMRLIII